MMRTRVPEPRRAIPKRGGLRGWIAVAVIVLFGAVGALAGWGVALTLQPNDPVTGWLVPFAMATAMTAGVMGGMTVGIQLARRFRHVKSCPQCGTPNPRDSNVCIACDMPLMQ